MTPQDWNTIIVRQLQAAKGNVIARCLREIEAKAYGYPWVDEAPPAVPQPLPSLEQFWRSR
jgi:hypothetical protein